MLLYIKVVLLLVLAPLQFGARDSGLTYLGSGVRANLITGDDPFTETMNLGIVSLQPHEPGPAPESVLTDAMMDPGTVGADASTPVLGQPQPQNGDILKPFGLNLPTPVPGKPPPQPRSHQRSHQRSQPRADLSN